MIRSMRDSYNAAFTEEKYNGFLGELEKRYPGVIEFRLAETPVFVPADFLAKMESVCELIINELMRPDFMDRSAPAIPEKEWTPGESHHCHCLAFDFGICESESGDLEPQLIEMQGFPSLFAFQVMFPEVMESFLPIPSNVTRFLSGLNKEGFLNLFRRTILGTHRPEHVVLLEIRPEQQKTKIDFICTEEYIGVRAVCITKLFAEGDALYYRNESGEKIRIHRIYNRVIADELKNTADLPQPLVDFSRSYDVEWVPHPNWFYRISKYTLPFLNHPNIPETKFLKEWKEAPANPGDYVLKPLFSFAGNGVIIDPEAKDFQAIKDPENWIVQRKVRYAEAIRTPDGNAVAELRLMYLWPEGEARPIPAINLARLSKGKMIGTRYNKDKSWVGGSVALFEQ